MSSASPAALPDPSPGSAPSAIASVTEIVAELRAGRMVILVDEEDRENEGDIVMAAEFVTPEAINFMVTHARGLVCLTLTEERCHQLELPLMASRNGTRYGTNFTVSIEAAEGVETGISAADRARTVQVAVAREARAQDLVQPGHIFPVMAAAGGVLVRAGHTEAGCDLTAMAGLTPAAVICEVLKPDGTMARLPDLIDFAQTHGLKIGAIADLIQYRSEHESVVERSASRMMTTPWGQFQTVAYRDTVAGNPHLALVHGSIVAARETLVRVHEPTTVLDLLDQQAPDEQHSWSVPQALAAIAAAPAGTLVLLNCQGSAQALAAQCASWERADLATTTPDTVTDTALPAARMDLRTYGIGAQILRDLGVGQMRLLARPRKMPSIMTGFGLTVTGYEAEPPRPGQAPDQAPDRAADGALADTSAAAPSSTQTATGPATDTAPPPASAPSLATQATPLFTSTSQPGTPVMTPYTIAPNLNGSGLRLGIVRARFNEAIGAAALEACLAALAELEVGAEDILVVSVPGALELGVTLARMAETDEFDALIALGAVIRGETYHFEVVSNESAAAIARVALETGVPVANGVLTTDSEEQAQARAAEKGADCARCAVEMANLLAALEPEALGDDEDDDEDDDDDD